MLPAVTVVAVEVKQHQHAGLCCTRHAETASTRVCLHKLLPGLRLADLCVCVSSKARSAMAEVRTSAVFAPETAMCYVL